MASNPAAYELWKAFPAAVFGRLDRVDVDEVREIVAESWRIRAPRRVVKAHPEISPAR